MNNNPSMAEPTWNVNKMSMLTRSPSVARLSQGMMWLSVAENINKQSVAEMNQSAGEMRNSMSIVWICVNKRPRNPSVTRLSPRMSRLSVAENTSHQIVAELS